MPEESAEGPSIADEILKELVWLKTEQIKLMERLDSLAHQSSESRQTLQNAVQQTAQQTEAEAIRQDLSSLRTEVQNQTERLNAIRESLPLSPPPAPSTPPISEPPLIDPSGAADPAEAPINPNRERPQELKKKKQRRSI